MEKTISQSASTLLFAIIARRHSWMSGFPVPAVAAGRIVEGLNALEEDGDWDVISIPIPIEEVPRTFADWEARGIA
jgi:hypothetical protein